VDGTTLAGEDVDRIAVSGEEGRQGVQMDFGSATPGVVADELDAHAGGKCILTSVPISTNARTERYADYLDAAYGSRPESYYRQFLRTPIQSGASVLDWGCGLGGMLLALEKTDPGLGLHGADIIRDTLDRLREARPSWDLREVPSDPATLPWADSSFDRIFLLDVVEHVREPLEMLSEAHRTLKPGGILVLSTPDRWAFYKRPGGFVRNLGFNWNRLRGREWVDPTHLTEFTAGGLRALLRASKFGDADFHPSVWHRSLWLRPPKRHYSFIVELARKH